LPGSPTGAQPSWAYCLRDTIPGATDVIELDDARLFFPDERATELTAALRRHLGRQPVTPAVGGANRLPQRD
jgi:hypothetical protein